MEILVRDSQSSPARAGEVARDLIARDQVDMMLVSSTPETTNPVADACEAAGMPCVSTVTPYQPWYLARNPAPDPAKPKPYQWTWHFFWGLEDIIGVFADMWGQVENNQVLGGLWPDDGDGQAWSDGFPGGPRAPRATGSSTRAATRARRTASRAEIERFKAEGADIVTGVPLPPDFATFWKQAAERDYRPRIASVGKALLFPAFIEAMGTAAGVSTEVWWSPGHPFTSSLTGASAGQLAEDYQSRTGRQWIQPIGFVHALFEVAASVIKQVGDVADKQALADAIKATSMSTIVGKVDWTRAQADFPNVSRTPLVGGQWRRGRTWPFELAIVSNTAHPEIPATSTLQPIT